MLAACGETAVATTDEPELNDVSSTSSNESEEVEETVPPLPSTTEPPPGVVADVLCEDGNMCAEEFILNGRIYSHSCGAVKEEGVLLDEVIGSGTALSEEFEVLALVGYPTHDVVAVSIEGGICSDDATDEFASPWSFAWTENTSDADIGAAICQLGLMSDELALANGC